MDSQYGNPFTHCNSLLWLLCVGFINDLLSFKWIISGKLWSFYKTLLILKIVLIHRLVVVIMNFLYILCPLFSCPIRRVVPFFFTYLPCDQFQCGESNTHWLVFPVFYDQSWGNGHCQACQGRATKLLTVCLEIRVINCRLHVFILLCCFCWMCFSERCLLRSLGWYRLMMDV